MISNFGIGVGMLLFCSSAAAAQTPLHIWGGPPPGSKHGNVVKVIGDTDGDGFDDVAVAAPGTATTFGQPPSLSFVNVYSGLTGAAKYSAVAATPNQNFAVSLAGIGDFNGDGFVDFAVGCTFSAQTRRGNVHIFNGHTGGVIKIIPCNSPGNNFGFALENLGDINQDGRSDLAVGATLDSAGGTQRGAVICYAGGTGALLRTVSGASDFGWFGYTIANAGDVDGDGAPDMLVSAPHLSDNASGSVSLCSGASGAQLWSLTSANTNDGFGFGLAGLGDVTGDGSLDIAIGAPLHDEVFVLDAATLAPHHHLVDATSGSLLGQSISPAGDVNGSGRPSILIGRPGPVIGKGAAYVVSGLTGAVTHTLTPSAANNRFGYTVDGGHDLNLDGLIDEVIGEPGSFIAPLSSGGFAYAISIP